MTIKFLITTSTILTLLTPGALWAYDTGLQCTSDGPGDDAACVVEDFSTYLTPSFLGSNFTSPNGFFFERLTTGPQFQIQTLGINGNWLFVPGQSSVVHFPVSGTVFTFALTGGGYFEISTFDTGGNFVQTIQTSVFNQTKVVRLGPVDEIAYAIIHHITDSCEVDFNEPYITDVRICEF